MKSMNKQNTIFIVSVIVSLLFGSSAMAGKQLYKWTAEDGSTYYSDAVPPEEAKRALIIMDSKGNKIKKISRAKTAEEYRKADKEKKRLLLIRKKKERKQKIDRDLRRMYPTEDAIARIRDEKIAAIDNGISLSADALKLYRNNIASLRKRAAEYARARKKMPGKIKRKIKDYRKLIIEMEHNVKTQRNNQEAIRQRYEKILTRYREIK